MGNVSYYIYYARVKNFLIHKQSLLLLSIAGAVLTSCGSEEWATSNVEPSDTEQTETRQLVTHEVTVALDGETTRVDYASSGEGLQLSWEAEEKLGVYIQKGSDSYVYAGIVTSNGTAGDRGARRFSGTIAEKSDAEQYVYIHPALSDETQGNAAQGKIYFTHQTGDLSSIGNYIPLIWHEGSSRASNQGYALHLQLTFNENPGTITQIVLQTMPGVGETSIFPALFDASTMSASTTYKQTELTVSLSVPATEHDGKWTADAYLACSHLDAVNVFRTKFNVKVSAANGTYYNEFRSFPGQESATSETGLKMLANGKCYHLATAMSRNVATTVINSTYKVNSLLGMWDVYGKTIDPFGQVKTSDLPSQLSCKETIQSKILTKLSSQGTPTFTWDLLVQQIKGSSDGTRQTNVSYNNITIERETAVYVTFLSEYAWSQNLLGYYHYLTAGGAPSSPGSVLKTIIFPNVSKPGHVPFNKDGTDGGANINPNGAAKNIGNTSEAPLQEFTTVQLLYNNPDGTVSATFPAGTTIGFMMMRDTQASNGTSGEDGTDTPDDHAGYSPRSDNSLINWSAWRLFTNTAWNSNNTSWYGGNCSNFFVSGKVVGTGGSVIDGLAIYGVKDDPDHNYNYSFSSMLFLVSTSYASAMTVQVPGALNLGEGALVTQP